MKKKILSLCLILFLVLFANLSAQNKWNKAANFNGSTSYIAVPHHSEISPTNAITIEAWIYPKSYNDFPTICGKNWQSGYWFGLSNAGRLRFYPKGGLFIDGNNTIPLNTWTHVAAAYNGTTTSIYINGILDKSTTDIGGLIPEVTDSLYIGCDRNATQKSYFFNGMIDNLRIWSGAKDANSIKRDMYINLNIINPTGLYSGLAASYPFDNMNDRDWSGAIENNGNYRNITIVNQHPSNHVDYNTSLILDGSGYCSFPNDAALNAVNALTLEAWICWDSSGVVPASENIINKSGTADRIDYALYILPSTNGVAFKINGNEASTVIKNSVISAGLWTHIAATYKASTGEASLYVNGDLAAQSVFTSQLINNNPDSFYIGGIGASTLSTNKFKGQLDEIRIWKDSVRTQEQIKKFMHKGRTLGYEYGYSSFNFDYLQNRFTTTNEWWSSSGLKFTGNVSFSSQKLQQNQCLTAPLILDRINTNRNYPEAYKTSYTRKHIPGAGFLDDSVYVAEDQILGVMELYNLINHTRVSDLRIQLTSPLGTTINILPSSSGAYEGNDLIAFFADNAENAIDMEGNGLTAPFSDVIKPFNPLSNFNGENMQGWWKIRFQDVTTEDTGFVHAWGLHFSGIVPVELTSFTAVVNGNDIELNWFTATETNNQGFKIERKNLSASKEKVEWQQIDFVNGKGTCTEITKYSYMDNDLTNGKYVYRLAQMDYDGSISYSPEVEIEIVKATGFSLEQNYPNPFNPLTTIKFQLTEDAAVLLEVYSVIGEKITELLNQGMSAGSYIVEFIPDGLSSGLYFYKLSAKCKSGKYFEQLKKMMYLK